MRACDRSISERRRFFIVAFPSRVTMARCVSLRACVHGDNERKCDRASPIRLDALTVLPERATIGSLDKQRQNRSAIRKGKKSSIIRNISVRATPSPYMARPINALLRH
jgi:hypothetical protein